MELVSTSIAAHIYAVMLLLIVMIFNLFSVIKVDDFLTLSKRLKMTTPLYHMANAIVAYTGGIVAAFSHDFSPTVAFMLVTTIFIMILEIKRYKKQRVIKLGDFERKKEFLIYAKKIYIIEISAVVITYIIVKIF